MAFIGTDDDENKDPNQQASSAASSADGGGSLVGGTGTGSGQGATTGTAAGGASTPSTPGGGGYTNLSQYLSVNQGAGATTGQAAGNVVQQSADAATGAQGAYSTSANTDINNATSAVGVNQSNLDSINAGQQNVNQDTLNQISSGAYSYNPISNYAGASQDALNSAVNAGKDASSAKAYSGQTDFSGVKYGGPDYDSMAVQYAGPSSVGDFGGQTAANQAAAIAANQTAVGNSTNAGGGQTGVSALLRQAYQQPQYSKGENNLDAFLAGGTTGGQQALSTASGLGQNVENAYSGIQSALGAGIQHGMDTASATNTSYKDAIAKATNASQATQDRYNAAVKNAQSSGASALQAAKDASTNAQAEEARRAQVDAGKNATSANSSSTLDQISGAVNTAWNQNTQNMKTAAEQQIQNAKNAPSSIADAAKQTLAVAKNPVAAVKSKLGGLNRAHGGEIPYGVKDGKELYLDKDGKVPRQSYGSLIKKLRGK